MNKIYLKLMAVLMVMGMACVSCSEEEPFSTITPDDYPQILDPVFPDWSNGEPAVISQISRDANFKMKLTVTPSDYTEVTWMIDGVEVQKGDTINISLEAGTYRLKVVATTTAGASTSREAQIVVSPLQGEPWSEAVGLERIVATGTTSRLYGTNLSLVKSIKIGDMTADVTASGSSELGDYIEYVVPTDLTDGQYRISLVDVDGNRFGVNLLTVTSSSLITGGFEHIAANSEWVMTRLNMDKITSLDVNGTVVTDFLRKNATEIAFTCPAMADGEYLLKGTSSNGQEVKFYAGGELVTEVSFAVVSETILWEGHHYVSWDYEDGNPNKTFSLIPLDAFNSIIAGSTLSIYYSVEPEADYHQIRTTTVAWNDLPGTSVVEFQEDGMLEVVLAQEALDKIKAEGGFLCVGHGYYVDRVSVK